MTREEAIERIRRRINGMSWCIDDGDKEALETIIPELVEDKDEKIRKEINILYADIDACITELLKARTDKDSEAEGKALFKMEGLMVGTLQGLSCIEDYLEKQKEKKDYRKLYEDIAKSEWFKKAYEGKPLGCDYEQKEQKPLDMAKIDTEKAVEILNKINVLMKIQHRSYLSNELEHIIKFIESNIKNG